MKISEVTPGVLFRYEGIILLRLRPHPNDVEFHPEEGGVVPCLGANGVDYVPLPWDTEVEPLK